MTAAHIVRPARRRARAANVTPEAPAYAEGHFTELLRKPSKASPCGWPPRFEPRLERTREVEQSEISRINREKRVEMGDTGTIVGLSKVGEAARLLRQISAGVRR